MLCFSFRSYLKNGISTSVYEGQCAVIKYVNHESIICFVFFLNFFYDSVVYKTPKSILLTTFSYGYYDFRFQAWPYYRKIMIVMLERSFLFPNLGLTFVVFKYG